MPLMQLAARSPPKHFFTIAIRVTYARSTRLHLCKLGGSDCRWPVIREGQRAAVRAHIALRAAAVALRTAPTPRLTPGERRTAGTHCQTQTPASRRRRRGHRNQVCPTRACAPFRDAPTSCMSGGRRYCRARPLSCSRTTCHRCGSRRTTQGLAPCCARSPTRRYTRRTGGGTAGRAGLSRALACCRARVARLRTRSAIGGIGGHTGGA